LWHQFAKRRSLILLLRFFVDIDEAKKGLPHPQYLWEFSVDSISRYSPTFYGFGRVWQLTIKRIFCLVVVFEDGGKKRRKRRRTAKKPGEVVNSGWKKAKQSACSEIGWIRVQKASPGRVRVTHNLFLGRGEKCRRKRKYHQSLGNCSVSEWVPDVRFLTKTLNSDSVNSDFFHIGQRGACRPSKHDCRPLSLQISYFRRGKNYPQLEDTEA
jgi:hypothetical protein